MTDYPAGESDEKKQPKQQQIREWIECGAQVLLVIAAVCGLIIYGGQLSVMRDQERPFLALNNSCLIPTDQWIKAGRPAICSLDDPWIFDSAKEGEDFTWWVGVMNEGSSPANRTELKASLCVDKPDDENPPTLEDCGKEGTPVSIPERPVFSKADPAISVPPRPVSFTRQQILDIQGNDPARKLYVIGEVTYFEWGHSGPRHTTRFCLMYGPNGKWMLRYCRGGQFAD